MKRKPLIIVVISVIIIVLGIVVVVAQRNNSQDSNESDYTTTEIQTTGLDPLLSKIPGVSLDNVNTSIMGAVRKNIESPKESYEAQYRNGTFQQTQTPAGTPLSRFLVDIPEIQRTFQVEVEGSQQTASMTIYTVCPQPGQSAYGEQECNVTP